MVNLLDCTLRDGGYYTNWDFSKEIVDTYLESMEQLPIEYLEVGYRSKEMSDYFGAYFYLPEYLMKHIKERSSKKLVIILNEKDVRASDCEALLTPCIPYIHTVRLAVDPNNFERALELVKSVKELGFEVCFNLMYMSTWSDNPDLINQFSQLDGLVDTLYMVDSFGGVYPEDVKETFNLIKTKSNVKIGFHGHNNLELALINTLTAIDCGVDIVDATITGMGRGAGNLSTELLLTVLNTKRALKVDFNALSKAVDSFEELKKEHKWGANLAYMVSGANSLPQKNVMAWMSKKHYSVNSIIRALTNESKNIKDNDKLPHFNNEVKANRDVLIIGGGNSVLDNQEAIKIYLNRNPEITVIHASSKNAALFNNVPNLQFFCLIGNEGQRLEQVFKTKKDVNGIGVLPPYPRKMGTYIPKMMKGKAFELEEHGFFDNAEASHTSIALQLADSFEPNQVFVIGYDGYASEKMDSSQQELFMENTELFKTFQDSTGKDIIALTATRYKALRAFSIFGKI